MRRSHQQGGLAGTLRDTDKMGKLRKELHTDDDGKLFPACVAPSVCARELVVS